MVRESEEEREQLTVRSNDLLCQSWVPTSIYKQVTLLVKLKGSTGLTKTIYREKVHLTYYPPLGPCLSSLVKRRNLLESLQINSTNSTSKGQIVTNSTQIIFGSTLKGRPEAARVNPHLQRRRPWRECGSHRTYQ